MAARIKRFFGVESFDNYIREFFINYVYKEKEIDLEKFERYICNVKSSQVERMVYDITTEDGQNIFHIACLRGNTKLVILTLDVVDSDERQTLMSIQDRLGNTAISLASSGDHAETVEQILLSLNDRAKNFEILMIENEEGDTPLSRLAFHGHTTTMKKMLFNKISRVNRYQMLQQANKVGNTPLHQSACRGQVTAVQLLLTGLQKEQKFQLVKKCNHAGESVVFIAALGNHLNTVDALLNYFTTCELNEILKIQNIQNQTGLSDCNGW